MDARFISPPGISPTEDAIQIAYIAWCRLFKDERRHAFHVANESKRSKVGYMMQGKKGTRSGASDNFVPAARMGWNGLFLELKKKGECPTEKQNQFGADMQACGYCYLWADSLDDAILLTTRYMAGEMARPNWVHYGQPVKVSP